MPDLDAAQWDSRRWRWAQRDYIDEPLDAVPREQVQCSSLGRPWHGMSLWHQRADAQDLYIPPAGKHCIIVRRGPDTGLLQRHGNETHDVRWKTGDIGSGTVSNADPAAGSACIAERRVLEILAHGAPRTDFMRFGDSVQMQARCEHSVEAPFGRIAQRVRQFQP